MVSSKELDARVWMIVIVLMGVCWLAHTAISAGYATPWSPLGQYNKPAPAERFQSPDSAPTDPTTQKV